MLTPDKQDLKVATGDLVAACGGQERAVKFTRFARHQAFSDFANCGPDHEARFIPIDALADLEARSVGTPGHPVVTRAMAKRLGFALVPLPKARCETTDFTIHLQAIIKESADVAGALCYHLNKIPASTELAALRAETDHAIQALVELKAALAEMGGE